MDLPVIIIGAGGHAAVVADALLQSGREVLGFTDADDARRGTITCGLAVLGGDDVLDNHPPHSVVLANGIAGADGPSIRRAVQQRLEARGWRFVGVRHPTAVVSTFAQLASGAQVLAAGVVQARAEVGYACIVNTGAVVEHDVSLGAWAHVAPGAVVCGGVTIGEGCHIGAGAVVREGVRLGDHTIVGAGAAVVSDFIEGNAMLVGIPARRVERKS